MLNNVENNEIIDFTNRQHPVNCKLLLLYDYYYFDGMTIIINISGKLNCGNAQKNK